MNRLRKNILIAGLLFFLTFQLQLKAQTLAALPRSTPEEQGVSARAIRIFLDSVAQSKHEFHSFMLLRHGKVIAEAWWNPYRADLKHSMYSLSKSFTATAVGFAKAEGKLSLADKVVSFFPNDLSDSISQHLQQLNIKDLLTMSVGHDPDPTIQVVQDSNWVKSFLALPVKYEPGSRFLYNTTATYMLSAIVQKVTGQKVIDYLRPRLFEPLGIIGMDWETDLHGINTGGWGLRLKTEDIARFAQLFLQKGIWNGKQLLPVGWVEEASTAHIIQHPQLSKAKRANSDWEQGYGYQMWRSLNNAYRGDGAFGQYAVVMPDQDAVIAITSETSDMQGELNLIWKVLLPAMENRKLPINKPANAALQQKLKSLSLSINKGLDNPSVASLEGKTFIMEPNAQGVQSLKFAFQKNNGQLILKTDTSSYTFNFSADNWQNAETNLPGPYLLNMAKNNLQGLAPFKVAGKYTWLDANTLQLVLRYIESPHSRILLCHFDGDKISLEISNSFDFGASGNKVVLKGTRKL